MMARYHPDDRISAAIGAARQTHPYYATAIDGLRIIPDASVPTMSTSTSWVTHYNPETVRKWTTAETAAVIVHELEHLLRRHSERGGERDAKRWNIAGDAEINERLPGLPDGAIYPETLGMPRGMTAETYYGASAPQQQPQPNSGDGDGQLGQPGDDGQPGGSGQPGDQPGQCGSAAGGPVQDHERNDALNPGRGAYDNGREAREDAARRVLAQRPGPGQGSDDSDELRDWAMTELGIDRSAWYAALAAAVGHTMAPFGAPTRWRWPGRRDMRDVGGAMIPRWTGERPSCAVVIDTSGSIEPFDLDMARAAAHYIGRMADVRYYGCNTQARDLGTTLPDRIIGQGGTDMRAGIDLAIADGARAVVVITDCETGWGYTEPGVPVIIGANPSATRIVRSQGGPSASYPIPDWAVVIPIVDPDSDH